MVDLPQLLGALPGHEHLEVSFIGVDGLRQSDLLAVGEPLLAAAQQVPDAIERVALAAPLPVDGLSRTEMASASWSSPCSRGTGPRWPSTRLVKASPRAFSQSP